MTTAWFSLRRRLLALLLGGVSVAWLVTMVFSYVDAHHEVDELFDAQLAQSAQTLLTLASHEHGDDIEEMDEVAHKYQRRLRFQIWNRAGELVIRSHQSPASPLTAEVGFSEVDGEDGHWRYFSQWNADQTLQVQVGENHHIRDELVAHIAWRLLFPALFGLPLIGLWVWVATRHGLASLDGVAQQIASREPQQLQPVVPETAPMEIRTMVEAINGLFSRVEHTLDAERQFTADAAHELRTPLAALQAQVQVALRARDDAERDVSLQQLQVGLVRASHLIEQMLILARLDPESDLPKRVPVNLPSLLEGVCAEIGPTILAKNLEFDLEVDHLADGACQVAGHPEWLRVLVRNLVDNAVRYTPSGGCVRVRVEPSVGEVRLIVSDSGPGIPADARQTVLKRFHRLHQGEQIGSGLGLAIVQKIADLHGAQLSLSDGEAGGLAVQVLFPTKL